MWLTGFDAPSCSTVYLDKPMRNHTLMQTIARANRVFPGKHSGLIVDYANVFASLEKALAIYGAGRGGATPVRDKAELIASRLEPKCLSDDILFLKPTTCGRTTPSLHRSTSTPWAQPCSSIFLEAVAGGTR